MSARSQPSGPDTSDWSLCRVWRDGVEVAVTPTLTAGTAHTSSQDHLLLPCPSFGIVSELTSAPVDRISMLAFATSMVVRESNIHGHRSVFLRVFPDWPSHGR